MTIRFGIGPFSIRLKPWHILGLLGIGIGGGAGTLIAKPELWIWLKTLGL